MHAVLNQSLFAQGVSAAQSGNRFLARHLLERAAEEPGHDPSIVLWLAWLSDSPTVAADHLAKLGDDPVLAVAAKGGMQFLAALASRTPRTPPKPVEYRANCPECLAPLMLGATSVGHQRLCPGCGSQFFIALDASGSIRTASRVSGTSTAQPSLVPPAKLPAAPSKPQRLQSGSIFDTDHSVAEDEWLTQDQAAEEDATMALDDEETGTYKVPGGSSPTTILLVDEDPEIRRIVGGLLRERGYRVLTVVNGEDALLTLRDETPRLVLSDIQMSGMDGYELCRRIKSESRTARTAVIIFSSQLTFLDQVQGRVAGCSAFLPKPCSAAMLFATVAESVTA